MNQHVETRQYRPLAVLLAGLLLFALAEGIGASSSAVAVGMATVDGRPLAWKNRDSWSTPDTWKNRLTRHVATFGSWGSGDRYTDRFNYLGVNSVDSFMRWMRTTNFDDERLRTELRNHQEYLASTLKTHYINGTVWNCPAPPYPVPVFR